MLTPNSTFLAMAVLIILSLFCLGKTHCFSYSFPVHHKRSSFKNIKSDASKNALCSLRRESIDESVFLSSNSRRRIIKAFVPIILTNQVPFPAVSDDNVSLGSGNKRELSSLIDAVTLIEKSCNRKFLNSVVASNYNFLYRGIPPSEATNPSLRLELPDLLDQQTYDSKDATKFFKNLEKGKMSKSPVKPSNGHLAVTCPRAAAQWGTAASIWPLGDNVHFAWYQSGGNFWPRDNLSDDKIIVDGIECGQIGLEDALRGDNWEVMFSSDKFLAVPFSFDKELRKRLKSSFII